MPDWSILAIFTLIAFFAARATKGLVKYVLYIVTLVLAGSTVGAALCVRPFSNVKNFNLNT